jgi:hypothetical protein
MELVTILGVGDHVLDLGDWALEAKYLSNQQRVENRLALNEILEKAILQCLLTPRFERDFYYKLQNFKKKWDQFFNEAPALKVGECINHFKSYGIT